jgi:DNA-binding MarR family transcriptional regulator
MLAPMKVPSPAKLHALDDLFRENAALFHRVRAVTEDMHREQGLPAALRDVLLSLAEHGPRTVPQMARARPVSRQHVQILVNRLIEAGLVQTSPNPAHRRSHLIRLTSHGAETLNALRRREAEALAQLPLASSKKELRSASATLRAVREWLEGAGRTGAPAGLP